MSLLRCISSLSSSSYLPCLIRNSSAMLSTLPAVAPLFEPSFGNPYPGFETGFTPWDFPETTAFTANQSPNRVVSSSGSDENHENAVTNSGSPEPNQFGNTNSGSDEPNQSVSTIDERRRRRMISNRESARRSRMRKQKHLENLRNQLNRLRVENRELTNRVRFVLYHCHRVRTDNDRLRAEHSMLRQKLTEIQQILLLKQLQQYNQLI